MPHTIFPQIWQHLRDAVTTPNSLWRTPTLSTINEKMEPDARVVVVRTVNEDARVLECFADARSPKIAQCLVHPRVTWVFYDRSRFWGLRAYGSVEVHMGDFFARERLRTLSTTHWPDYLSQRGPGRIKKEGDNLLPTELEEVRRNFAVIVSRIDRMDWVELRRIGNSRAIWEFTNGEWKGEWVEP